jgi:TP901 family phage tail tape measure protein
MFVVGEVVAPINADIRPFQRGIASARGIGSSFIKDIGGNIESFGKSMTNLGGQLTKAITVPLTAAAIGIFKFGKDFETEMSKVIGLVGVSKEQVKEWSDDILQLAPTVGKMPNELADAMFFVTSAGLRGAAALDVLTMSAKASAAGLGETKTIADLVTSAMNAYGQENLSAAKATDIITAAVREGKVEASELAATMGAVLPLASEMGVTFDQVAATQASMTRTGTDAAEAATQLKGILAGLIKPSKQAEEQLNAMGTSSSELRKKIKEEGLLQALIDLREMTNKYGEEAMARVFPNIRALMGVLDLMGGNLESNKETFDKVTNSVGILDEAFKAASETTDFKFNQALAQLQATAIKFFDVLKAFLVPILERFVDVLGVLGDGFAGLPMEQQKLIIGFLAIAAAVGPAIMVIGNLLGTLGAAITGISTIAGVISSIGLVIPAAIAGITLLVGGLAALILSSDDVRKSLSNTFNDIQKSIGGAIGFIQTHIDDIIKAFKGLFEGISTGNFGDFMSAMSNMIPPETMEKIHEIVIAFVEFQDIIFAVRDSIIEFAGNIIKSFGPVIDTFKETISNLDFGALLGGLDNLFNSIQPLIPLFEFFANVVKGVVYAAIGIIVGALNGLISILPNVYGLIFNLYSVVASVFSLIVGIVSGNSEMITESLSNLWESIKGVFVNAVLIIFNFVKGFVDGIISWFQSLYDTLVGHSIIPDFINSIINWFAKLPGKVIEKIKELVSNGIKFFNNFKESVLNKFNLLITRIKDFVNKIASEIKTLIKKGLEAGKDFLGGLLKTDFVQAGINIVKGIIKGIKNMFGEVSRVAGDLAKNIRDFLPFSPAKEGPLKDLDKIDFGTSIKNSLKRASKLISIPSMQLGAEVLANIQGQNGNFTNSSNGNGLSANFYGDINLEGVQDMENFLSEMKNTIQKHTGRRF